MNLSDLEKQVQGDLAAPENYSEIYQKAGDKYKVDPKLLQALVTQESGGNPTAESGVGAKGLTQLMPAVAKAYGVTDTSDPEQTINATAQILRENLDKTNGDLPEALRMYHGGPNKKIWGEKTAAYAPAVLSKYSDLGGNDKLYQLENSVTADLGGLDEESAKTPTPPDGGKTTWKDAPVVQYIPGSTEQFNAAAKANPAPVQIGQTQLPGVEKTPEAGQPQTLASIPVPTFEPPAVAPDWGPYLESGNALLLGQGPKIMAGARSLINGEDYSQAKDYFDANREAWLKEHPGKGLAIDAGIGGASTLAAMATGQEYALAPAAARLSKAVPELAPTIAKAGEFLAGNTGRFAEDGVTAAKGIGNFITQRLPSLAAAGAAQGATTGVLQNDLTGGAASSNAGLGAIVGAVLNPLTGGLASAVGSKISPKVAEMVKSAQDLGIDVKLSQIPGASPIYHTLEKFFGSSGTAAEQRVAATRALTRTFGEDSPTIDHDLLTQANNRIGGMFDQAESGLTVKANDPGLLSDLANAETYINRNVTDPQAALQGQKAIDRLVEELSTGDMTGQAYRSVTKHGTLLDNMASSKNPEVQNVGFLLRDALDDAAERSSSPEAIALLRDARSQYKNYKIASNVADETTGTVDPSKLLTYVKRWNKNYARQGAGDIGTIAETGKNLLERPTPAPVESNPLMRKAMEYGAGPAGIIGAYKALEYGLANPTAAAGVLGAGTAALGLGKLANSAVESNWYKQHLLNRALNQDFLSMPNPLIPSATQLYSPGDTK